MYYLSDEDVLDLYAEHIGDSAALLRPELLSSAVALPQARMFGEELYPHISRRPLRCCARSRRISRLSTAICESRGSRPASFSPHMIRLAKNEVDIDDIGSFLAERSHIRRDAEDAAS